MSTTAGCTPPIAEDEGAPPLRTQVFEERAKSILTRNSSPDIPFSVSLNPYRGCEHGCIYCFARPTHSYLGLSPGLDFESRIYAKINAPELLERELAKPNYEARADRARRQHGRVSAGRARSANHAARHSGAARLRASVRGDHEEFADRARHRPACADGRARPGDGGDHRHHARCRYRTHARAARGDAVAASAHDPHACRGGHSGRREHRTGHSVRDGAGHGACSGSVRRSRRDERELYRAASAVGSCAALQGLACRAFPRSRGSRDEPRARHARRQGLRLGFFDAHERRGSVGRHAEAALSKGDEAPWA